MTATEEAISSWSNSKGAPKTVLQRQHGAIKSCTNTGRSISRIDLDYTSSDIPPPANPPMSKPQVLLLGIIDHAKKTYEGLSDIAELVYTSSTDRGSFIKECPAGAFDHVVAVYRTFPSVSITGPWDAELIDVLPKSLRYCAHNGAGYDQIDVAACSAREPPIFVSNVPTAVDDATADAGVFLMLGALRGFNTSLVALREGTWRGSPLPPLGHDPEGKTLGVLGMGGIGRNMMKKCQAFGMTTIYHNRKPLDNDTAGGATYVSFDELLAHSDVLSLNLPLNVRQH